MEWKREGVMDGDSGDEGNDELCVRSDESDRSSWSAGWRSSLGRWFQRQGDAWRKERLLTFKEEGGWARVTLSEERVQCWVVVRTLYVRESDVWKEETVCALGKMLIILNNLKLLQCMCWCHINYVCNRRRARQPCITWLVMWGKLTLLIGRRLTTTSLRPVHTTAASKYVVLLQQLVIVLAVVEITVVVLRLMTMPCHFHWSIGHTPLIFI